jgi:hypothetical protein
MPKRTIEEGNLANLLSSALEAPVRAEASAQPAARRRWWLGLLAAAALILAAVLGALWLLRSGPEPAGLLRLPAVTLPFPELLAESMRKLDDIDTMVVTCNWTREGEQEMTHIYYKKPNHWREELSKNIMVLDDGTRKLCLDPEERKVTEVGPSILASHSISTLVRLDEFKAMVEHDKRPVKLTGPFQDSIDGMPCQRYDFETTMPAQPQMKVPERKVSGSCWFSVESRLMQRFENRINSFAGRLDYRYNVPVDDALFVIPDWAQGVKPQALTVAVRDDAGRPTPDATVYFGRLGSFKKLHLDAGGEAELPSEATAHRDPTTDALYVSLGNDVVVESADGGQAALYTFDYLSLVIGKGLKERVVSQDGKSALLRDFTEQGPGIDLRYDAERNSLTLGLTLAPKATVTGRIVDEAGHPVSSSSGVITTTYRVRNRTANVAYGQLDAQEPAKGALLGRELSFGLNGDGTFELRLPTNYPLTLGLLPLVPGYHPTTKELTLKPGERVDLGDLVLKSRTPDQPQP